MSLKPGDIIDNKYRIVRLLGEGGMGAVFEGENTRIKRRVAIKVLHAAIAHDAGVARRFQQEAQAAGHIGNEHIIEVLDLGELPNGDHFMVLEYLDGQTLTDRIKSLGRFTPEVATPIFRQILEGLAAAHAAGILHRDLKPDNIFILNEKAGRKDFVKIIDFGISKFQPLAGEMKMTRTGTLMGTPYYMSPEQASGAREMNDQSDIYAIGVILYEALTGAVPFDAPTFNQLMFRIVLSEACPIERLAPDLNPAFASIVKKAMAREQSHRFETCHTFIEALDAWAKTGVGVDVPPAAAADTYLPEGSTDTASLRQSVEFAATGIAQASDFTRSSGTLSKTNQAWANTQGATAQLPTVIIKKNKTPMLLAAAAGALVLVGGGVLFAKFATGPAPIAATGVDVPVAAAQPLDQPAVGQASPPEAVVKPVAEPAKAAEVVVEGAQAGSEPSAAAGPVDPKLSDPKAVEPKDTEPSAAEAELGASKPAAGSAPIAAKPRAPRNTAPKNPPKPKRRDFGY